MNFCPVNDKPREIYACEEEIAKLIKRTDESNGMTVYNLQYNLQ